MKNNIIYGLHPVMEAIKSGKQIDKIFVQKSLKGTLSQQLLSLLHDEKISYKSVPIEKLNKLTRDNHQGVVAFISPITFANLESILDSKKSKSATFVLLDGITDPRNFGAIVRTAAATDVTAIIIPENNSAPINEDAVKTSAGGIFKVPIVKVKHLKDAIFLLQAHDIKVVAATEKSNQLVFNIDLKPDFALIMGSEGKGVNKSILQLAQEHAKLPMSDKIDSLNVSVACGVILYESVRQRLK
jgi:23S rRNA (guanosine2251-2'-O)-methyltransferase